LAFNFFGKKIIRSWNSFHITNNGIEHCSLITHIVTNKNELMKNIKHSYLVVATAFFFISFCNVACGGANNDAAIQTKISSITQNTAELQSVSASVSDGVVTLIGNCRTEEDRERAEKAVEKIDDVKDVINNITITNNVTVTSDGDLRDQVDKVVKKYKRVQAQVDNGIITVRGNLDKDDLQQMMMDLNGLRPKRIDNQLVVE
jgi:hyperosmotically inducible protein